MSSTRSHIHPVAQLARQINVQSLSFDGCIFNEAFYNSRDDDRLFSANQRLLEHIKENIDWYDDTIFMMGSYRQSGFLDLTNIHTHKNAGSSFAALIALTNYVKKFSADKVWLDRYLLADSYGGKVPGDNFTAHVEDERRFHFDEWLYDESKLTILYAQMHKVASENPDSEIFFDFYDEKNTSNTLTKLRVFFNNHADLMPENVTLRLNHYSGRAVQTIEEIKGAGGIDYNYHQNLQKMLQCAGLVFGRDLYQYNVMNMLLKNGNLNRFKRQRCLLGEVVNFTSYSQRLDQEELQQMGFNPDNYLLQLRHKIGVIAKTKNLSPEGNQCVHALMDLHQELIKDITRQVKHNVPPSKIYASEAMRVANATVQLIDDMRSSLPSDQKLANINDYHQACKHTSRLKSFAKAALAVCIGMVGFVLGGLIGFGIGVAAGSITGPGAAATGAAGLFAGASAGAIAGVSVGAGLCGITSGSVGGYLLFRQSPVMKKVNQVRDTLQASYEPREVYCYRQMEMAY